MITEINESKILTKHYHLNVNVEDVIQIKSGTTINQKNIICAEKIILAILLCVVVKMVNI